MVEESLLNKSGGGDVSKDLLQFIDNNNDENDEQSNRHESRKRENLSKPMSCVVKCSRHRGEILKGWNYNVIIIFVVFGRLSTIPKRYYVTFLLFLSTILEGYELTNLSIVVVDINSNKTVILENGTEIVVTQTEWNLYFVVIGFLTMYGVIVFIIFGSGDLQPWAMNVRTEDTSQNKNDVPMRNDVLAYTEPEP